MTGIAVNASIHFLSWSFPDEQTPLSLDLLDRPKAGEGGAISHLIRHL